MKKLLPVILAFALVAVAGAAWMAARHDEIEQLRVEPGSRAASSFDESAPVVERIEALEHAVGTERQARQLLQEEVFILTEEIERLTAGPVEPEATIQPEVAAQLVDSRRAEFQRRNASANRAERLIAGGFSAGEAAWIVKRESELQMEALQARYDAEKNGTREGFAATRLSMSNALREELGDADYERYLESNGRSTRVAISSVLESSPAQTAGLQNGDEIVNYDGQRVFSMSDLNRQTMQGEPGQNVVVDFMRDGVQMQIVIPRGPVGITGGRRFGR